MKLFAELVPSTVWNSSLFRLLPRKVWKNLRDDIIEERGRKCQICSEINGTMNLHEIWNYDDINYIQKLDGFILLCKMCHHIKHIGLARILAKRGKLNYNELKKHFCNVNNCSEEEFKLHINRSFRIWGERSSRNWKQDFGEFQKFIKKQKTSTF